MWEIIIAAAGFLSGYIWCVLFRVDSRDQTIETLRKTNAALARRIYLIEQVYQPRRAKKIKQRLEKKKTCDKGKCDGSCK
mgnify:CR=1 FL=1|tara:strand:+ start:306 stop:545 length:240 start_codon:yes stop_codon:yes gene_type:complete